MSNFRSAYTAGKREIEMRRRPFSLVRVIGFSAALILAFEVDEWLAIRFTLSGFEKHLLDLIASFIIISVLLIVQWRIPLKRKNT